MEIMINKKIIKRATSRSPTEAAIICRPYVSCHAFQTADGVMRNFSSQGSYIETSGKFESGAILILRMLRYPSVNFTLNEENQPRTICLAEVKWRHKLSTGNGNRYGMGLKYLD